MAFLDYNPIGHSWDCGCAECSEPEMLRCFDCRTAITNDEAVDIEGTGFCGDCAHERREEMREEPTTVEGRPV